MGLRFVSAVAPSIPGSDTFRVSRDGGDGSAIVERPFDSVDEEASEDRVAG